MVIKQWCRKNVGEILPITASKDFEMSELWDDRAVGVIVNTGLRADQSSLTDRIAGDF